MRLNRAYTSRGGWTVVVAAAVRCTDTGGVVGVHTATRSKGYKKNKRENNQKI